jgi:hypothetical protein
VADSIRSWLPESGRYFVRYLLAGCAAAPFGLLYGVLVGPMGFRHVAFTVVPLVLGFVVARYTWVVSGRQPATKAVFAPAQVATGVPVVADGLFKPRPWLTGHRVGFGSGEVAVLTQSVVAPHGVTDGIPAANPAALLGLFRPGEAISGMQESTFPVVHFVGHAGPGAAYFGGGLGRRSYVLGDYAVLLVDPRPVAGEDMARSIVDAARGFGVIGDAAVAGAQCFILHGSRQGPPVVPSEPVHAVVGSGTGSWSVLGYTNAVS